MIDPVGELRAFLRAALLDPVPRAHADSVAVRRRRRVVAALTLVAGAAVLAWTLRIRPGDPAFYPAAVALALVWTAGGLLSGPLHLGRAHTRAGRRASRALVQSLALGVALLALFLAGGVIVARLPTLRGPVEALLAHGQVGSLPVVALVTAVNAAAEELYFRGALYAAVGRRHAVAVTTIVYAAVTAAAGIPLLVLAAAVLGVVTALQRRVTGGVLGPTITHLTWSLGMLVLLPAVLAAAG